MTASVRFDSPWMFLLYLWRRIIQYPPHFHCNKNAFENVGYNKHSSFVLIKDQEPQLVEGRKLHWLPIYQKLSLDRHYWSEMWKGKASGNLEAISLLCILKPALQHFFLLIDAGVVFRTVKSVLSGICVYVCHWKKKKVQVCLQIDCLTICVTCLSELCSSDAVLRSSQISPLKMVCEIT